MRKGKLYISFLLGLCLCLFTAFGVACKDESSTGNSSTGGDSSTEEPATPTLESISVSGATEVFIDEFDYADYTITATYSDDSTQTATLTADNLSAEDKAKLSTVGTHALTVSYESVTCSWTVTLKNHDFAGLTFDDITTTYDGTAKTLAVAGLPTGAQVSYDKATSYTNAGEYTVKATVALANYNPVELTATLTIKKAVYDMSAVIFADKTVTYNGESHSILATNLPNGVTAQYTGNNKINADEYTITATFTGDSANYELIASQTATLTINKATYDMSGVVFKDKSVNYTGEAYSIEATNLPSGVSATYDGNNQTQAGEYTVTAHFTGDSVNYNAIPNMTAKLKINASDLTGISFHDGEFTYDGTEKSIFITGELPEGVEVEYTNNEQINADSYTVTAKFTCTNGNYTNLPELTATLTIKKAVYDMSAVVFADKTVTYNGESHSILATNLPNGVTAQYTGNNKINADEYTITATFTGDSQNYELIANKTATLTIEQRELTLAFGGETTLKYIGSVQKTVSVQTTNLVNGDSVELTISYNGEMIEAGEYIATATLTAHQNYKLTANNTVKVIITRATHTVTFKQDGFADVTREVLDLADLTDIPTPQHVDGYKFTWNRTEFTSITEDITVTANKTVITYTIEYVVYDGVNSASNPTTYTVESATFTLKNPTTSETFGKSFGGWFTSPDFTAENKITKIEKGSFGDLKLYAYWLEYRVTEVVGGTVDYSQATPEITIKVDYGTANLAVKDLISVSDGCTWKLYTGFECLPTQELTAKRLTVSNVGDNIFYILVYHPDSDEYYTDYILNVYQLDMKAYTFIKDGETWASGEIQEESAVNAPENPKKDGYTFNGWSVDGTIVSFPYTVLTGTVFIADYTLITYNVSYKLNGGENDESNPNTYNIEQAYTLKNPTRTGYTFVGWFTEETFENQATEIALGSHGDKKFYAKWNIITYTVSYELNGGENSAENPKTYTVETETITLAEPTKTGYGFKGWYLEETFETRVYTLEKGSHGDKKFYAKWGENTNTLKFDGNGATGGEMSDVEMKTSETVALPECGFVKAGYSFIGWAITADGDVVYTDGANYTMGTNSEYTLYAKWTANLNTLKFDGNGATMGKMSNMSIKTSETVSLTKYGYHKNNCYFVGWALTPDGEVVYTDEAEYAMGTDSEYTLYAVWVCGTNGIEYTLSNGGTYYTVSGYSGTETDIKIPSAYNDLLVTSIGSSAFADCDGLTSIIIPDSVTSIGESAFEYCSSLTSIIIPDSVTSIGESAFEYCSSLTSIIIPDSVISIADCAFFGCSSLTEVVIPDSVTRIERAAFEGCNSLTSIEIPDSVTSIGSSAFCNCSSLTEVVIPDSVTGIDSYAFKYCSSLTSVVIGNGVTSISYEAFYYCSRLTSVVIPDSVTSIGSEAFYYCSRLTSVEIGNGVTSIGSSAFYGCSRLTSVVIGDSVTSIGSSAFYNCSSLTEVVIPDSVTGIDSYAFKYCSSLTSVEIGDSVISIGEDAFSACSSLTNVVIPDSVTSIGEYAFSSCSSLTSVVIGDSVTSIGRYAFSSCSSLTSVVIGDSVTSIGEDAFSACSSLTSVYITDIEAWCNISFKDFFANPLSNGASLYLNNELVTDLQIPNTITEIKEYAFCGSSLTSVEIPDSVTSIGYCAFFSCSSLTSVVIGDGATNIGGSAFSSCSSLTSVVIGDSITSIGENAFYNCDSLTEIVIPDSVRYIGRYAFESCSSLANITLSNSVSKIDILAFRYCSSLTSVYYKGTEEEWSAISIGYDNAALTNATRYYYSETAPALNADGTAYDGNYWHYDESGEIVVWVYTKPEE